MTGQPLKPPSLGDLFNRYLQRQAEAQAQGLGLAEPTGDVVPHDAAPVQPIDSRQAWEDALAVLGYFPGLPKQAFAVPPDWATLIGAHEPAVAVAFCLGNTPQLVRDLQPVLAGGDLADLQARPGKQGAASGAMDWANGVGKGAAQLLAAGVLRLAGHFDEAAKRLQGIAGLWQAVAANELAALNWHEGKAAEAQAMWSKQAASVPVLFNLGMAALFLGDFHAAATALTTATAAIPETSPWHHLGRLYLALAEGRN